MSGIPTPNVEVQWASDAPDAPDEADLRAWAVKAVAVAGGVGCGEESGGGAGR